MTRPRTAHATSVDYRDDWRTRGLCCDDPEGWDLDVIGYGSAAAQQAKTACLTECPVLDACRAWTDQLIAEQKAPQALVQAGEIYPAKGQKVLRRVRSYCLRGHLRTPDSVYGNGDCKQCSSDRTRQRRRKKTVKEAT